MVTGTVCLTCTICCEGYINVHDSYDADMQEFGHNVPITGGVANIVSCAPGRFQHILSNVNLNHERLTKGCVGLAFCLPTDASTGNDDDDDDDTSCPFNTMERSTRSPSTSEHAQATASGKQATATGVTTPSLACPGAKHSVKSLAASLKCYAPATVSYCN